MLLDNSASAYWGVECWMSRFGFDTTAGVDVDVEPVSERVLRFGLNTLSPSPAPHVQTLGRLELYTPGKQSPDNPPLRGINLPSESEGWTCTCDFIVIVWSGDQCHSVPQLSTRQASRGSAMVQDPTSGRTTWTQPQP